MSLIIDGHRNGLGIRNKGFSLWMAEFGFIHFFVGWEYLHHQLAMFLISMDELLLGLGVDRSRSIPEKDINE